MTPTNPRFVIYGAAAIMAGILIAVLIEAPAPRLLASLTLIAVGFGLVRQAFKLE